jgi:hypothetical protein
MHCHAECAEPIKAEGDEQEQSKQKHRHGKPTERCGDVACDLQVAMSVSLPHRFNDDQEHPHQEDGCEFEATEQPNEAEHADEKEH